MLEVFFIGDNLTELCLCIQVWILIIVYILQIDIKRGCEDPASGKFWSDPNDPDQDQDLDLEDMGDPRDKEDWKIKKRRGFLKDRESKAEQVKLSKTAKRNSKEPMFDNTENTFDFLDEIILILTKFTVKNFF